MANREREGNFGSVMVSLRGCLYRCGERADGSLNGVRIDMRVFSSFRTFAVAAALAVAPAASFGAVFISVGIAPPVLPVYTQPICPGDGYLWTPGYWAYGDEGYYWVPGVWVQPPTVGYLWTPGYWGWGGSAFLWHAGYWGPHVGFYGGVNYGFGYVGSGYEGGYWNHGVFAYNRSVNNINVVNVHNVYNKTVVVNNVTYNRVSYNGGNGGVPVRPNAQELVAQREQHVQATPNQMQHEQFARSNRGQLASVNHGNPGIAAQARVGDRANVVPARGVVNTREGNQQQRIANGVRSGQMSSGEAARADMRQGRIDQQVHNDRQANGGALTPQQRGQVNREQNGASQQIYRENHNANVQPQARVQQSAQPRQEQAQPRQEQPRQESRPQQGQSHGEGGHEHSH